MSERDSNISSYYEQDNGKYEKDDFHEETEQEFQSFIRNGLYYEPQGSIDAEEENELFHSEDDVKNIVWEKTAEQLASQTVLSSTRLKEMRKKSNFNLNAFSPFSALHAEIGNEYGSSKGKSNKQKKTVQYSESLGIPGVARLNLSPLTQKLLDCVIDEDVTTEYPWIHVRKDVIEDDLDLHSESSEFLPVKNEIEHYMNSRILLGYAPNVHDDAEGQFYICLTDEARNAVVHQITTRRMEQEDKVRNALMKSPSDWCKESNRMERHSVDDLTTEISRPLFQIEIELAVNKLMRSTKLENRSSDDQRDGYIKLVPHRESFNNITKLLIDKGMNATSIHKESEAQTFLSVKANSACQCQLDQRLEYTSNKIQKIKMKLAIRADEIYQQAYTNTIWDVYTNDYANLAANSNVDETVKTSSNYVECQSYFNGKLCVGKIISDLAWHPELTGVAAVAYTTTDKSQNLIGPKSYNEVSENNQVLIWSFDDSLHPKLILECNKQVNSVSFCPRNGNIVIGGCSNGQIVIWDITGKIEEVEMPIVKSAKQVKHETLIRNLRTSTHEPCDRNIISPTAMSSLQSSQTDIITKIEWLSPFKRLDARGRIHQITGQDNVLSTQFVTSSKDGTIAFWDLDWRPEEKDENIQLKSKKVVQLPKTSDSPYQILNGQFQPLYILVVQYANELRNASVTSMSMRSPLLPVEQVDYGRNELRGYYRVLARKSEDEETIPVRIFIGTARGECGTVSWEGYDFSTGVTLNKEICKWNWRKQLHDGPVSHTVRSPHLRDLLLTVGGHIFALWRENFQEPILWKKSEFRYTACCWDTNKSSVLIVARNDGTAEIWDIEMKNHEPTDTRSLSGRIITGVYAHALPLQPQYLGFCDYNGALRIFHSFEITNNDTDWMHRFIEKKIQQIEAFKIWSERCQETNTDQSEAPLKTLGKAHRVAENKSKEEKAQQDSKIKAEKKVKENGRKHLIERMQTRWVTRELDRMQRAILEKKGLKEEELERRREPLLRRQREEREMQERRQRVMDAADELFVEAITEEFPQEKDKFLITAKRDDQTSLENVTMIQDIMTDKEIIDYYKALDKETLALMREHSP